MRILIIRPNSGDFGKVGTYNVQEIGLANALMRKGHAVDVLFTHKNVKRITNDSNYTFVHYIPHISIGLHGLFKVKILSLYKPEHIILFSDNQIMSKNIICWCKKNKISVVNYFGGVLSDNPRWINQFYTKMILHRNRKSYEYSVNIAKTKKVYAELEKCGIKCKKVVNVGLDLDLMNNSFAINQDIKKELGFSKDDIVILFIGRLVDYKRPLFACDLLKNLQCRNRNFKMVLIGKGPLEQDVKNFIHSNHLDEHIFYHKRVPYNCIYKYMVVSNCLINISPIEIFGMTILEAMFYGVPVVAHHAPGPDDVLTDTVTGYLLDSFNIDEWCNCIDRAVNNKSMIESARKKVINQFTWDVICKQFLANQYKETLE